ASMPTPCEWRLIRGGETTTASLHDALPVMLATQVAARLGEALDTRVPVRLLFEASTVAALAVRVEQHAEAGGRKALVAGPRPAEIPLSLAQQRMWFLNRFDTDSAAYNVPIAVRLSGDLDIAAL